jgi:AcrR family transcriptional regulator
LSEPHTGKMKRVGRPRDEESHRAILDATLKLAAEKGLHGASIEAIARLAGVGKTTIYRHWDSKEDLILDVLRERHIEIPMIDTGNLREDLALFLREVIRIRLSEQHLIMLCFRLYIEGEASPQFIQMLNDQFFKERLQHAIDFIEAAKKRGDIRADLDATLIMLLVGGPILYNMFLSNMFLQEINTDDIIKKLIDIIMEGIQARSKQPEV